MVSEHHVESRGVGSFHDQKRSTTGFYQAFDFDGLCLGDSTERNQQNDWQNPRRYHATTVADHKVPPVNHGRWKRAEVDHARTTRIEFSRNQMSSDASRTDFIVLDHKKKRHR